MEELTLLSMEKQEEAFNTRGTSERQQVALARESWAARIRPAQASTTNCRYRHQTMST